MTYHVKIGNRCTSSDVVLVKHPLELVICKLGTSVKTDPAPRLIRSTLVFHKHIRRIRALLKMCLTPIRRQCAIKPVLWVRAIHSKWIRIMPIDIDWGVCSWSVDSTGPSHVVNERNNDSKISELFHQAIHVVRVWEGDVVQPCGILIFGLEEDDGSAICDLRFCQNWSDGLDVVLRRCLVVCIWRAKIAFDALKPARKSTAVDFGVDVWPGTLLYFSISERCCFYWVCSLQQDKFLLSSPPRNTVPNRTSLPR